MNEWIQILIGVAILILGYFIGNFMRKETSDEQKDGRKYFKILTFIGLVGGILGLILGKDWLLFFGFFVAIVSSRSLVLYK